MIISILLNVYLIICVPHGTSFCVLRLNHALVRFMAATLESHVFTGHWEHSSSFLRDRGTNRTMAWLHCVGLHVVVHRELVCIWFLNQFPLYWFGSRWLMNLQYRLGLVVHIQFGTTANALGASRVHPKGRVRDILPFYSIVLLLYDWSLFLLHRDAKLIDKAFHFVTQALVFEISMTGSDRVALVYATHGLLTFLESCLAFLILQHIHFIYLKFRSICELLRLLLGRIDPMLILVGLPHALLVEPS